YAARLPGADDTAEVWEVLRDGRCTISDIPPDRWSPYRFHDPGPVQPGVTYANRAGLVTDPYAFDCGRFGISPREAAQMDPQQRMLLETTARAFDHAAIDPSVLDHDRTGVFVGASGSDHSTLALQDPAAADAPFMLGNTLSILSNRISYAWDFRGPSFTIDTACS